MTISRNTSHSAIKTLINLSSSKRSLMLLSNPYGIQRPDWSKSLQVGRYTVAYVSLSTDGLQSVQTVRNGSQVGFPAIEFSEVL